MVVRRYRDGMSVQALAAERATTPASLAVLLHRVRLSRAGDRRGRCVLSTHGEMSEELSRLLIELIDGRLRPAAAARLSQILRTDDDAVNAYVRYVGIHSLLDWRFATPLPAAADEGPTDVADQDGGAQHDHWGWSPHD
jgi:hypothetical protein